ncbi:hypothetical protein HELRODRAFT_170584 [Helobdella robusta]|uniref:Uncharacterized protein n=1 Tax=Helobdella robusta TaxID=6412 RepID=T1F373_HELRO|nr:hypothetical protein HELRODRAFT_170584 [Helobdella robusta]ESO07256.1 hypothetical protein HELRODRAFT_170584 [Helobdella robusta]
MSAADDIKDWAIDVWVSDAISSLSKNGDRVSDKGDVVDADSTIVTTLHSAVGVVTEVDSSDVAEDEANVVTADVVVGAADVEAVCDAAANVVCIVVSVVCVVVVVGGANVPSVVASVTAANVVCGLLLTAATQDEKEVLQYFDVVSIISLNVVKHVTCSYAVVIIDIAADVVDVIDDVVVVVGDVAAVVVDVVFASFVHEEIEVLDVVALTDEQDVDDEDADDEDDDDVDHGDDADDDALIDDRLLQPHGNCLVAVVVGCGCVPANEATAIAYDSLVVVGDVDDVDNVVDDDVVNDDRNGDVFESDAMEDGDEDGEDTNDVNGMVDTGISKSVEAEIVVVETVIVVEDVPIIDVVDVVGNIVVDVVVVRVLDAGPE